MARKRTSTTRKQQRSARNTWNFPLTRTNLVYFGIALGVIVVGYGLMATGITSDPNLYLERWANPLAIVVAPVLLVIAYCIIVPVAIMKRQAKDNNTQA
ncbi:MAG: DUF3098 domain-containing protein [Bacteroidota bacterium]|nr:DUF3098 domain-containing protein [Candidatus Kapabacteria bacterium]MDW8221053.1 DUF3098 domain-containing protein [Bacteroidota bacterium]